MKTELRIVRKDASLRRKSLMISMRRSRHKKTISNCSNEIIHIDMWRKLNGYIYNETPIKTC